MNDSLVNVSACKGSSFCLHVENRGATSGFVFDLDLGIASNTVQAVKPIGKHSGGRYSNVAVYSLDNDKRPTMQVIDVDNRSILAAGKAPVGTGSTYFDFARDPGGKLYPFMVPPYGTDQTGAWRSLCVFKPGATGACGAGFADVADVVPADTTITAGAGIFRETGGYLQDIDGDGWEDVNVIFHAMIRTVSLRKLAVINTTTYDVAARDEPNSPKWFHSGRNYGIHAAVTAASGKLRDVIFGGVPIGYFNNAGATPGGSFADAMCNVSRFIAVLESDPGVPSSRHLAWSNYYGFHSNIYRADWSVARAGNFSDQCIHHYLDGRTRMDGQDVILFNRFAETRRVSSCVAEQIQFYTGDPNIWYNCMSQNLKSRGRWAMQVISEDTGQSLASSSDTYVWGWSDNLVPGGQRVYLVESLPSDVSYDFSDVPLPMISVRALKNGAWTTIGTFPARGRIRVGTSAPTGSHGEGSETNIPNLQTSDIDGDGLQDALMYDGTYVGWDKTSSSFVRKSQ